ncbi:hypothetical protein STH2379 [Symbiobacterium thermophilum IAM 14863]|uniref:Uncharacterized protein n=1 Tax=Symbiobacterium thermophilum (strain DSM 24528 / JCM 14929 / IAM 14863 / T) TaxID=292459 RepID=Q67LT2_SYMTH|nr:hypothetical protein STH2379 [Symbiobacterium thermophilum IAM 14863]
MQHAVLQSRCGWRSMAMHEDSADQHFHGEMTVARHRVLLVVAAILVGCSRPTDTVTSTPSPRPSSLRRSRRHLQTPLRIPTLCAQTLIWS